MQRARHVPIRICVLCGDKRPKREMVRIVRKNDDELLIDERGSADGRGCYVCLDAAKFDVNKINDKIKRALKLRKGVPSDFIQALAARIVAG